MASICATSSTVYTQVFRLGLFQVRDWRLDGIVLGDQFHCTGICGALLRFQC